MGNSGSAQEISRVVGIVPTKITAFVILILILVPILLRQIIAGGAARTPERAPLVSTKAGMIAEHRTDAVEQQPAANHARCRRCGGAEKRTARTEGWAHARCQTGTRRTGRRLRGIFLLPSIGGSRCG